MTMTRNIAGPSLALEPMKRLALLVTLIAIFTLNNIGAEAFVATTRQQLPIKSPPRRSFRAFNNDRHTSLASRSLLFRSSDGSASMDTRRIRHNNNMLARTSKRHLFTIFSTLWLLPQRALATSTSAATTTTTTTSALTSSQLASQMLLLFHSTLRWIKAEKRTIVTTAVSIFILRTTVKWIRCKRRQALDATSEWGRYAKHPGARGRALLTLALFKVLPLWILSKVVPNNRFRQRILKFSGRLFARGLIQLGALYIKLGQIVSSREDLLPIEWLAAMECLQDQVPAKSGQDALDLAYSAWPAGADDFERTFRDFETTPLAAASLGQVHKAVINIGPNEGDVVAIKLQRPFLREIYDQDLSLLTKVAAAVDKFGGKSGNLGGVSQSWTDIFQDAEEILYREIDYRDEAANGKRFCDDFGLTKGGGKSKRTTAFSRDGKPLPSAASWLRAPYVYDDLSSEKVLVMEFVPSIKINNYAKLAAANVTMEQREYLADCLGRAYLRQFCCNRFFSTDPHAGNLGAIVTDKGVQLVFYDFGQAATLNPDQAEGILEIIEAIVDSDVERSIGAFSKMGVLKEGANLDVVRAKVADNYKTGKVKANRKRLSKRGYKFKTQVPSPNETDAVVVSSNTTTGKDSEVMQYFTLPAEYAFVGRALMQMGGVGNGLDPEFDFISSGAPWIYEIKGTGKYLKDEVAKRLYSILPHYVDKEEQEQRRSAYLKKKLEAQQRKKTKTIK